MPVKVDPEKAEKEIRSMFYRVNKRPENLDNVMASDGGLWREDESYLRPQRSLNFNRER